MGILAQVESGAPDAVATIKVGKSAFDALIHIVAHVCGVPLSRYTCRATRVAANFPQNPGVFQV